MNQVIKITITAILILSSCRSALEIRSSPEYQTEYNRIVRKYKSLIKERKREMNSPNISTTERTMLRLRLELARIDRSHEFINLDEKFGLTPNANRQNEKRESLEERIITLERKLD